jgi:hypothetical protein
MEIISAFSSVIVNAFGRRFAGGLLGQWFGYIGGTQVARLVQALLAGGTVAVLGPVWWWGAPAAALVFFGATAGFPPCGMVPKNAPDVGGISQMHGWAALGPLALAAAVVGLPWWPLVLAAFLRGPCYWLATLWQPHVPVLGLNPDGIPDPPAIAEFYVGALFGLAIWLTLM